MVKGLNLTGRSVTFCTVIVIDIRFNLFVVERKKVMKLFGKKVFIIISTPRDTIPIVEETFDTMLMLFCLGV